MELSEESIEVDVPREVVIEEMQKPAMLQRTIPNCQNVEAVGERQYVAEVSERIAMVSLDLVLDIDVVEFDPPDSFAVEIQGQGEGSDTRVSAEATFDLFEPEPGKTTIDYAMDIDVSGKLASLGFRMIQSTIRERSDQMIANIEEAFAESSATPE